MQFWLTTGPNPKSSRTGFDAGQRGWRKHAINKDWITTKTKFEELKNVKSVCGLLPAHGWSDDLFIEEKCKRCEAKLAALVPKS